MQQVIWPSWTFEKAFGHSEWHSGDKLYNCEQCGDAGDLKRHLVTHSGEKPHRCAQCKHSTTQAGALKTHIMTHTGVKPHQCGQCGYSSNKLPNMRQHEKVHSGAKPHKCAQCDFSQLATHEKRTYWRKAIQVWPMRPQFWFTKWTAKSQNTPHWGEDFPVQCTIG